MDPDDRPEPPARADEWQTLNGFLDFLRATVEWKLSGLTEEQLRTTHPPSALTLIGLAKHLAHVEDEWANVVLWAGEPTPPFDRVDWAADGDWEFTSAPEDATDDVLQLWRSAVGRSRELFDRARAEGGLDRVADRTRSDGFVPNLRWILVHLIEEYGRHCGHIDLIRESLDGLRGE